MILCSICKIKTCEESPYTPNCDMIRYGYKCGENYTIKALEEWARKNKGIDLKPLLEEWRVNESSIN